MDESVYELGQAGSQIEIETPEGHLKNVNNGRVATNGNVT
jgi:hypothetical protein